MISNITFKSNSQTPIEVSSFTVVCGPNNSGKSLFLTELADLLKDPISFNRRHRVIAEAARATMSREKAVALVRGRSLDELPLDVPDDTPVRFATSSGTSDGFIIDSFGDLVGKLVDWDPSAAFLGHFTHTLDAISRLRIAQPVEAGDLKDSPRTAVERLFKDDALRARWRGQVHAGIGYFPVIDPTAMSSLSIRMSTEEPPESVERSLSKESIGFFAGSLPLATMSQGLRSFVGLITSVMASDDLLFLLDEPDAFLHPPLVRRLAHILAAEASNRNAQIIAATHSPDFLHGAITSGMPITIVRLTYAKRGAHTRTLPSNLLLTMMRDPLVRSSGFLSSLFHDAAVICEADGDRVLYQEVNDQLNARTNDGMKSACFLNAQNWQTIGRLMRPLRDMGVPAAAIVDLDAIKDGPAFLQLIKAAGVPPSMVESVSAQRARLAADFSTCGADPGKGGVANLPEQAREGASHLIDTMSKYGVFLVPVGQLEDWVLGQVSRKAEWLAATLEALQASHESSTAVRRAGFWDFIRQVSSWVRNESRKGM